MRDRKKRGKRTARKLSTLNPAAAGLDVGSTFHVVAVSPDRDSEPVRTFQSFTADLAYSADHERQFQAS